MKKILTIISGILLTLILMMSVSYAQIHYTIEEASDGFPGVEQIENSSFYKYEVKGKEYYFYRDSDNPKAKGLVKEFNQDTYDFFINELHNDTYKPAGDYYMLAKNNITQYQAHFTDAWASPLPKLQIYDKSLNLVSEKYADDYIESFGYSKGKYYYKQRNDKIFVSNDAKEWSEGTDDDIKYLEYGSLYYTYDSVFFDGDTEYYINFESVPLYKAFSLNRSYTYISRSNNKKILLSRDNVYYVYLNINSMIDSENELTIQDAMLVGDFLYIDVNEQGTDIEQPETVRIKVPLSDIDAELDAMAAAPYVMYDNKILAFEVPPVIEEGRTLIPIRFLFETMGATVTWEDETRMASIEKDGVTVTLTIDDTNAYVNGEAVTLDVPARLVNGKTMVPVRFLSENLGYNVDWNGNTRVVTVE